MKKYKIGALALLLLLCACQGKVTSSLSTSENNQTSDNISDEDSSYSSDSSSFESSTESSFESSSEVSSSSSSSTDVEHELTYQEKIDAYLDGGTIQDQKFIDKIKSLDAYNVDEEISNNAIYASPNGNGNGSFASPYELQEAIDNVKPGQTIYLRGGTYNPKTYEAYFLNCKGNENNYITIRPYKNEKVTITNTNSTEEAYGFMVESEYVILEGIEIANIYAECAYGIAFWDGGQNHIIIRNCEIHHIQTTTKDPNNWDAGANAILLFGQGKNPINNIAIMNNYCHDNVNGWSENISTSGNCEYIYVFENHVSDNTNIGIDFYGNAGYCSTPSLDQPRYCIAANNYIDNNLCSYADCAGLYVDGARDIILQYNKIVNCQYGIEIGSEERNDAYPVTNILVRSNICQKNKVLALRIGGYETNKTGTVKNTLVLNNTFIDNSLEEKYAEIILAKIDGVEIKNNLIYKSTSGEIFATDFNANYTKNFKFTNNLIYQANKSMDTVGFYMLDKYTEGINNFNSLYNSSLLYHEFEVLEDCSTTSTYAIDQGEDDALLGNYDFKLNKRVNSKVDIGAIEA